jgi:hypothetical protein
MIKTITGNWYRNWSYRKEAGERVCRIERFLASEGYSLNECRVVRPGTERIVTRDKLLKTTSEKSIWDVLSDEIKPTDKIHAGNLHGLIWDVLNIKPECRRVHFGKSSWDEYTPGNVTVSYTINNSLGKPFSYVDLIVKTIHPPHSVSFGVGASCIDEEQILFDLGNTSRLIVEADTTKKDFVKKILEVARKKL